MARNCLYRPFKLLCTGEVPSTLTSILLVVVDGFFGPCGSERLTGRLNHSPQTIVQIAVLHLPLQTAMKISNNIAVAIDLPKRDFPIP